MNSKESKFLLEGHTKGVWSVCYSPDGNLLLSGSQDESIYIWDVESGKIKFNQKEHFIVNSISFSPNSTILASGSGDKIIYFGTMLASASDDSKGYLLS